MKTGILMVSPRFRAHLRRTRIRERLAAFRRLRLSRQDEGYLRLAEVVLLGIDSRQDRDAESPKRPDVLES